MQLAHPLLIKGSVLLARIAYLKQRPSGVLLAVLDRLAEDDRRILNGLILPVDWHPIDLNIRLDEAIAEVLSPSHRSQAFREMGRASADVNLRGVHRNFIKAGDPHHLLRHAAEIHRLYYDDGKRIYEQTGPHSAVLKTYGDGGVTLTDCMTNLGWHERGIELSGGTDVHATETKCRSAGGMYCEYVLSWS